MSSSIVVDASVWIHFIREPDSPLGAQLERLLHGERALVTFLTLAEVLQGARSEEEFEEAREIFRDIPRAGEEETDWVEAARMAFRLRRRGFTLLLPDCHVAAVCLRLRAPLLTLDSDFDRVPGLRRMKPERLS